MSSADRRGSTLRAPLVVGASLLLALLAVHSLSNVFGPLLAALGIAYACDPLVQLLQRRLHRRMVAVLVLFVLVGGVTFGLCSVVALQAAELLESVLRDEDGLLRRSVANLALLMEEQLGEQDGAWAERARDPEFWRTVAAPLATGLKSALSGLLNGMELAGALLLTPVYTFYLMIELPRIGRFVDEHLPIRDRERTRRVLATLHAGMADFLRGRLLISLLKGVLLAVGLTALGVPYAWVVGLGGGVLSVLPLIGPVLGFALAFGVALFDLDASLGGAWVLLWLTLLFAVAEGLENFVLTPWVMGEGVELHPLTVLFCVFFWGAMFGAFGALLAIPLTLTLKVVVLEYVMPEFTRLAQGTDGAAD